MKQISTFALAIFSLAASALSASPFDIKKVQPSVIRTPILQYTGDQRRTPQSQYWLEVEVEFQSNAEITDELTFKYYVLLAGKNLSGEVTHMNILKGRDLASVMYVSPHTIAKLLNNKPLTAVAIENVHVDILNKGQIVAQKSFKEGGGQWWQNNALPGFMYNKLETPFSSLYWDRYEEIKPPVK